MYIYYIITFFITSCKRGRLTSIPKMSQAQLERGATGVKIRLNKNKIKYPMFLFSQRRKTYRVIFFNWHSSENVIGQAPPKFASTGTP